MSATLNLLVGQTHAAAGLSVEYLVVAGGGGGGESHDVICTDLSDIPRLQLRQVLNDLLGLSGVVEQSLLTSGRNLGVIWLQKINE